jgi:hypothetical protein
MGFFDFFRFGIGPTPLAVTQDSGGNWFYTMFSSRGNQHQFLSPEAKLRMILASPAAMTIFSLQADMFSLGKVNSNPKDKNSKPIPEYLSTLRKTPNYKSGWTQFYWDYMFWQMMGTAYLYKPGGGRLLDDNNSIEWLNPAKMMWDPSLVQKMMDFIFTRQTYKDVTKNTVRYINSNGKVKYIPLNQITPIHDLSSNMNDNFYVGISRVDALYKIICNSEKTLDAKSVNIDFSKKWMVSGKQDPNNVNELPMDAREKQDIEDKVEFGKNVQANKTQIDIKRFTDNMAKLELDNIYSADLYQIGKMYNIPRDIIEAYTSSSRGATYENQEKAMVRHIEHSLKPKGEELMDALETVLDIDPIEMSWAHLACYNVFEVEKQNIITLKLQNAILAKENELDLSKFPPTINIAL